MRALVIGADGFAGRWLLRHLVESGDEVAAAVGPGYGDEALPADLDPMRLDVRDADGVRRIVTSSEPDVIYYLASVSRAGARDDLDLAIGISVHGALNTLAAAASLDGPVRLLHVGSSHMYAIPDDATPISEEWPIRPTTVYGAAKAAAEAALLHLAPAAGVTLIGIRAFNHIGPGQGVGFVVPSLAAQVESIRRADQEPVIRLGDLKVCRDFTDVRDVVRAYRLAAVETSGGTFNVASGNGITIEEILDRLLQLAGVQARRESVPELARPANPPAVIGDATRLRLATGWEPEYGIDETLSDILESCGQMDDPT